MNTIDQSLLLDLQQNRQALEAIQKMAQLTLSVLDKIEAAGAASAAANPVVDPNDTRQPESFPESAPLEIPGVPDLSPKPVRLTPSGLSF